MNVWYPNNVDDNALTSNECQAQPLSAPTEMTFFIFRSEFSELLREITDHASNLGIEVEELGYDDILSFDGKLKDLMNGLPSFFQLDLKRRNHSQRIEEERPYLKWQRGMAHFALHTRLTRLHRPYLVRGSHDPKHAYSRMVCLRSARMVIEMEKNMHFAGPDTGLEPTRLWTVIHHTFIAAVILLVDLLYNFGEPQSKERREEIMACCMTLEKAQAENTVARQGVDELKKVLRCWMVKNDISRDKGEQDRVMNYSVTQARAQSNSLPQPSMPQPIETLAEILNDFMPFSEDTGFDQMGDIQDSWPDAFDFGANFDSHQWTELFRDLECHPGVFE
ncbi:hypothetical protein MMC06_002104 [Schaereria dolodes]|nr:hypothetical protein [Schaereria dolodes]